MKSQAHSDIKLETAQETNSACLCLTPTRRSGMNGQCATLTTICSSLAPLLACCASPKIWHCSLCPDNQSLELVIYDEVEREVLLYNSGTGALDRKNKLDSGELELLMDVWPGWNSNTAYLLYCCCELATYDLASHELSFAKLEIPEGCISDASLDLNMSVVACKNNAFMVSYLLVGDCYHGEFDHIGIWKLDGEKWELVSKVSHSDGYDDEEMLKVEEEYEWRFSCCSDGFDKICIAIDKCEFMWMYSVEADAWRKLPSYPQAKTKMLDKIMFF
ncbi:hypothetical protein SELMODRAFT_425017 [Selaginella moellendorffii]|uniref:Uncharacterized protein n=1 Tax=Selaginella moellendorffii TaxID=88036 RepID=D8SRR7_SELML|nr:hypothetical protein SELMODRAFT_425017 [Selaginella moellendorffii]